MTISHEASLERAPSSSRGATVLATLAFAALTAVAARVVVPLPGTLVPFTLQAVAVLLSGVVLGPRLGLTGQAIYLGVGMAGLPVFAAGGGLAYLFGPTGGYLLAFPVAAAVAGAGASTGRARWTIAALVGGMLAIHAGGAAWLWITSGSESAVRALEPFLLGDLLKIALVFLLGLRLRPFVQKRIG